MTDLGMPVHPDDHWDRKAACLSHDPELWFPKDGSVGRFRAQQAKDICITECPVKAPCLRDNLNMESGIFGGLDEKERKKLRR